MSDKLKAPTEIIEPDLRELVHQLRAVDSKCGAEFLAKLCGRAAEQIVWLYRLQAAFRFGKDMSQYLRDNEIPATQCKVCGIKFDGPMGYVCGNPDCPTAVRAA